MASTPLPELLASQPSFLWFALGFLASSTAKADPLFSPSYICLPSLTIPSLTTVTRSERTRGGTSPRGHDRVNLGVGYKDTVIFGRTGSPIDPMLLLKIPTFTDGMVSQS